MLLTCKFLCITLILHFHVRNVCSKWYEDKRSHKMKSISVSVMKKLASDGTNTFKDLLDPMLISRTAGTDNHKLVKQYLIDHMQKVGWAVETDAFTDETPRGVKPFENIIATLNPDTPRRLVLACHYDSKYSEEDDFIGAIDSAVPCAMLLHLAETLKNSLACHKKRSSENVTLQLIFFDGEEPFIEWNDKDSLYGSRHLAQLWQDTLYRVEGQPVQVTDTNFLNRMDVMVLLDLLGTPNPKFVNYFDSTTHLYDVLVNTENALRKDHLWSGDHSENYFNARKGPRGVEDDHIPFMQRGVDIVHVIPKPFPQVWHTPRDNKDALDYDTIDNLNKIFRIFVAGYLHLA